jgi:hypothetical protein
MPENITTISPFFNNSRFTLLLKITMVAATGLWLQGCQLAFPEQKDIETALMQRLTAESGNKIDKVTVSEYRCQILRIVEHKEMYNCDIKYSKQSRLKTELSKSEPQHSAIILSRIGDAWIAVSNESNERITNVRR